MHKYVHGYSEHEARRLADTARTLSELLHAGVRYQTGAHVLEVGCGVGAQTPMLSKQSPETRFTCFDVSFESLIEARKRAREMRTKKVGHLQANVFKLPFSSDSFDHAFICYLLEHLDRPVRALIEVAKTVKADGTITAIEGDHGSCFFYPETQEAKLAWECLTKIQAQMNGDALIGRRMYWLFRQADLEQVKVSPIVVYCDATRPDLMEGFANKTIVGMLQGIENEVIQRGLIDKSTWKKGLQDLLKVSKNPHGSLCYTFFKALGVKKQPI
ncbi:MAG: class I SAM-dependent methyltransferase [Planctomycetota bacterium]|jgi:ubiquinone/menaquinone biosynthesis C-methylase UbiE